VVAFWSVDVFLTSARIRCTGGTEKVGPSAEKYFFDSIDPLRTSTVHRSIRDKLAFTGGRGPIPGYRGDEDMADARGGHMSIGKSPRPM
jgi:hypothetical protein